MAFAEHFAICATPWARSQTSSGDASSRTSKVAVRSYWGHRKQINAQPSADGKLK
jgi:hypothetical protein